MLSSRSKVQCVTIEGIAKKDDYEIGTSEGDILQSRDKWNAIYVKESWHLVHPRLGRKAKTKVSKYFILLDGGLHKNISLNRHELLHTIFIVNRVRPTTCGFK